MLYANELVRPCAGVSTRILAGECTQIGCGEAHEFCKAREGASALLGVDEVAVGGGLSFVVAHARFNVPPSPAHSERA